MLPMNAELMWFVIRSSSSHGHPRWEMRRLRFSFWMKRMHSRRMPRLHFAVQWRIMQKPVGLFFPVTTHPRSLIPFRAGVLFTGSGRWTMQRLWRRCAVLQVLKVLPLKRVPTLPLRTSHREICEKQSTPFRVQRLSRML